ALRPPTLSVLSAPSFLFTPLSLHDALPICELWVAHLGAAGEDARFWIFVCLVEQRAVAAVRERGQAWLAWFGTNNFLACPAVNVGHGQPAQAGERVVPPCTVVNRSGGDVAVFAFVDDIDAQLYLAGNDFIDCLF